ncbi:MAG: hypothetical protein GX957_04695 [Clostridiaceae bacterium]|nr:hypothetical protein [Clostridiaceae bacterium]
MLNSLITFKDSIINKFGPFLGYTIIVIGGLFAISLIGFIIKVLFKIFISLLICAALIFGIYKIYEWYKSKK